LFATGVITRVILAFNKEFHLIKKQLAAALTSHMQNHKKGSSGGESSTPSPGLKYRCLQCIQCFSSGEDLSVEIFNHFKKLFLNDNNRTTSK
jgi:hypothetical protein